MAKNKNGSSFPIIYVRGFVTTLNEVDDTTVDPFCGFNSGSAILRATSDRSHPPRKLLFESPLVWLQSDFGYDDVIQEGVDLLVPAWMGRLTNRSIVIYRFQEQASSLLGLSRTPQLEQYAGGLSDLHESARVRVRSRRSARRLSAR